MDPVIASLTANLGLSRAEATRLRNSGAPLAPFAPVAVIVSTGGARGARLILSGWACEMRQLFDGRRQIFSFLIPGDVCVIRSDWPRGGLSVVALTDVTCLDIDEGKMKVGAAALSLARRVNEARRYEAAMRLGPLTAAERVIHLLIELWKRMQAAGLARGGSLTLPLTQRQLADALGLTLVNVSRTLRALRRQALITFRAGKLTLLQPEKLARMSLEEV